MTHTRRTKARAFLTLEATLATVIVIEALSLFALTLSSFVARSDVLAARQRAALAAEAVLNEIRGEGERFLKEGNRSPSAAEFAARFSGMTLEVSRESGSGVWAGFTRLRVRVTARARNGMPALVQVEGYVAGVRL